MYTEDSIMTYEDFNTIEQQINNIRTILVQNGYTVATYTPKTWVKKDFLLYTYLNNIENGIKALCDGFYKPYGWRETKTWSARQSFSYMDVNRWIIDLNLLQKEIEKNPYITTWNGQSFVDWNSYISDLEWEE